MTWSAIRSAPVDGRRVLLYFSDARDILIAWFNADPPIQYPYAPDATAGWFSEGIVDQCGELVPISGGMATHWMPLPEPPL